MRKSFKIILAIMLVAMIFVVGGCDKSGDSATTEQTTTSSETETVHIHEFSEATCTEPSTCTLCGETNGDALGHTWQEATCKLPKTCTVCEVTEGDPIDHTGGTATCLGRAKCDVCGKVYGEVGKHLYEAEITTPEYLSTAATMVRPAVYFYACVYCGAKGTERYAHGGTIMEELQNMYGDKLENGADADGYMYFTDPHPVNCDLNAAFWDGRLARFEKLAEYYGYTGAKFAVCGGDWFNNSNSKESAIAMLEYIRNMTRDLFGTCYLVVGNHDYNYQFVSNGANGSSPHKLTSEELAAVWFPEYGKTYYSFTSDTTRYYVFDSGIDWGHSSLTDLDKEQVVWYLEQLSKQDDKHIVLMPHMVHISGAEDNYNPGTLEYAKISAAYNARSTYTFNGVTYDFSDKTGMVEYIIAGHHHADVTGTIEGIPFVLTATNNSGDPATADFVYADYASRTLVLMRVGNGNGRVVNLLPIAE